MSQSRHYGGQTRDELKHSLEVRDYGFLDSVDTAQYDRVMVLGSEAPYYFGLHLSIAGRSEQARTMFVLGTQKSPEPFKTLCLQELAKTGSASDRLAFVETLAQTQKSYETVRGALLVELGRYDEIPGGIEAWYNSHGMTSSLASSFPSLPSDLPHDFLEITAVRVNVFRKSYKEAWLSAKAILERTLSPTGTAPTGPTLSSFGRLTLSDFGRRLYMVPKISRLTLRSSIVWRMPRIIPPRNMFCAFMRPDCMVKIRVKRLNGSRVQ